MTPVLADLTGETDEIKEIREKYDKTLRSKKKKPKPQSHVLWALYDRIVIPPPQNYTPPKPDTKSMEPYSHCGIVKPYSQIAHPFYHALEKVIASL